MQEFGVEAGFDGCDYTVAPFDGYQKTEYQIEPDVSGACYFYAAAAMSGGSAKVKHVHWDSMQGDMKFLKLLEQMGCSPSDRSSGWIKRSGSEYERFFRSGIDVGGNRAICFIFGKNHTCGTYPRAGM